jgi:hypothetical protein
MPSLSITNGHLTYRERVVAARFNALLWLPKQHSTNMQRERPLLFERIYATH